jgi:hypothetical protein
MRSKIRFLGTLFVCMSVAFIISGCSSQKSEQSNARQEISPGEKALAAIEVQNVFSKHCYYHEAGKHRAEMEAIWVKKDGEFAKTAKWQQPMGINEGYDAIWQFYVLNKEKSNQQILDKISKIYPEIENKPENLGIGGEWASHTQSTAIIEVAGDGKTAKGIWESPGLHMQAQIGDSKVSKQGGWFWEKYAADFVKEDGKWKIWHIAMYYENTAPSWNADTNSYEASSGEGGRGEQGAAPGSQGGKPSAGTQGSASGGQGRGEAPSGAAGSASEVGKVAAELASQTQVNQAYNKENANPYKAWSPTKVPAIDPKFPEPYYTFSETFSY